MVLPRDGVAAGRAARSGLMQNHVGMLLYLEFSAICVLQI